MTLSRARRTPFGVLALALAFAGTAQAQIVTLFSENFEGPPAPPGNVGAYTEVDPLSGLPALTLWHEEAGCSPASVGPCYTVAPSGATYSTIVGSPSAVLIHGSFVDDSVGTIGVPIAFSFYGTPLATANVDSNGPVSVSAFSDFTNDPIPSSFTPNEFMAAWWDDNHTGPLGSVLFDVVGGSLVIEWNNVEHFPGGNGSGENATFQVRMNPSPTDTIDLIYDPVSFASGSDAWNSTIGVEDSTGLSGTDATGGGNGNVSFPATNLTLTLVPGGCPGAPIPGCMGTEAAAYNQGDIGLYNFNTGAANEGAIESPAAVSSSPLASIVMIFDYTKQGEAGGTGIFDQCFVEASPTGLGAWSLVTQVTGNTGSCGGNLSTQTLSLPSFLAGTSFQHRFRFDTVDSVGNDYFGWYVDNIRVFEALPGPTIALFSENFESGTNPGVTVGGMEEQDPFGTQVDTLWHAETGCGVCVNSGYIVTTSGAAFSSILGNPGAVPVFSSGQDDGYSGRIVTPFIFQHYGVSFQLMDINANGFLTPFPAGGGGTDFVN
ncbi:MAG: hypothetical protein ACREIU_15855, partial [Planctomycetota bacterium]